MTFFSLFDAAEGVRHGNEENRETRARQRKEGNSGQGRRRSEGDGAITSSIFNHNSHPSRQAGAGAAAGARQGKIRQRETETIPSLTPSPLPVSSASSQSLESHQPLPSFAAANHLPTQRPRTIPDPDQHLLQDSHRPEPLPILCTSAVVIPSSINEIGPVASGRGIPRGRTHISPIAIVKTNPRVRAVSFHRRPRQRRRQRRISKRPSPRDHHLHLFSEDEHLDARMSTR